MSGRGPDPIASHRERARTSDEAAEWQGVEKRVGLSRGSAFGIRNTYVFRFSAEHGTPVVVRALFLSSKFTFHYQASMSELAREGADGVVVVRLYETAVRWTIRPYRKDIRRKEREREGGGMHKSESDIDIDLRAMHKYT